MAYIGAGSPTTNPPAPPPGSIYYDQNLGYWIGPGGQVLGQDPANLAGQGYNGPGLPNIPFGYTMLPNGSVAPTSSAYNYNPQTYQYAPNPNPQPLYGPYVPNPTTGGSVGATGSGPRPGETEQQYISRLWSGGMDPQAAIDAANSVFHDPSGSSPAYDPRSNTIGFPGGYIEGNNFGFVPRSGGVGGGGFDLNSYLSMFQYPAFNSGMGPFSSSVSVRDPGQFSYSPLQTPAPFTPTTTADMLNDPGYQFRLQQGQAALEASAAAKGSLNSGNTLQDILNYGQNYASNEFQNVDARRLAAYQTNVNTSLAAQNQQFQQGLGTFSTNASTSLSAEAQQYLQDLQSYQTNYGNALQSYLTNYGTYTGLAGLGLNAAQLAGNLGIQSGYLGLAGQQQGFNQLNTIAGYGLGAANGVAGAAQSYGGQLSNLYGAYGSNLSGLYTGQANANAAGIVGSSNAFNQGLGQVSNIFGQLPYYYAAAQMNGGRNTSPTSPGYGGGFYVPPSSSGPSFYPGAQAGTGFNIGRGVTFGPAG